MNPIENTTITPHEQQIYTAFFDAMQRIRGELQTEKKIVWTIEDFNADRTDDQLIFTKVISVHHPYIFNEEGFTITDLDLNTPDNQQIIMQLILRGKAQEDFVAIVKCLSIIHEHAKLEVQKTMHKGLIDMVKYIGEGVHQIQWG